MPIHTDPRPANSPRPPRSTARAKTQLLDPQGRPIGASDKGSSDAPEPTIREVETLARWMDTVFEIPVLRIRFGWDSILGLFPGFGDVATSLASIYILQSAQRHGVPRITLARMTVNVLVDMLVGLIPFVGDAFDLYWKSNQRNVQLLRRHLAMTPVDSRRARRGDGVYVAAMIGLIGVLTAASITLGVLAVRWLATTLSQLLN
jgi:hypothetical protein